MKKIIAALLLLVSMNSHAGIMWHLVNSDFVSGQWFCTYQAQFTNYTATIISNSFCKTIIYQ